MTTTADLFNAPRLPGLASTSDFVTETEEQALIAAIDVAVPVPRLESASGRRSLTAGPITSTAGTSSEAIRFLTGYYRFAIEC